jgi:hypothetical protein
MDRFFAESVLHVRPEELLCAVIAAATRRRRAAGLPMGALAAEPIEIPATIPEDLEDPAARARIELCAIPPILKTLGETGDLPELFLSALGGYGATTMPEDIRVRVEVFLAAAGLVEETASDPEEDDGGAAAAAPPPTVSGPGVIQIGPWTVPLPGALAAASDASEAGADPTAAAAAVAHPTDGFSVRVSPEGNADDWSAAANISQAIIESAGWTAADAEARIAELQAGAEEGGAAGEDDDEAPPPQPIFTPGLPDGDWDAWGTRAMFGVIALAELVRAGTQCPIPALTIDSSATAVGDWTVAGWLRWVTSDEGGEALVDPTAAAAVPGPLPPLVARTQLPVRIVAPRAIPGEAAFPMDDPNPEASHAEAKAALAEAKEKVAGAAAAAAPATEDSAPEDEDPPASVESVSADVTEEIAEAALPSSPPASSK